MSPDADLPLDVPLDRASPVPLYFQLAQHWQGAIEAGRLPHGTRLDNEVALSERLGLSRPTVRRALAHLVDHGLLVRRRGIGTQVVRPRVRRPVELSSLYDDLAKSGEEPTTKVLGFSVQPADDLIAEALSLDTGAEVYAIERLRYARGEPLAILRNWLPAGLVRLTDEALSDRGLYETLRSAGIVLAIASQTIGARAARAAEARTLGEPRGAPLLTMRRTTYDDHGHAVEHGDHVYRASRYAFELTLTTR